MAEGSTVALVLYLDPAVTERFDAEEYPGAGAALLKFGGLVHDVLVDLCGLKEFSHVELLQASTSYRSGDASSPLAVVVGTPLKGEEGELLGVSDVQHALDIYGVLTASAELPSILANRIELEPEEGMMTGFSDAAATKLAERYNARLGLEDKFPDAFSEEEENRLAEALGSELPAGTLLAPLHPEDILHSLPLFLTEAAGVSAAAGGPGLFSRGKQLVSGAIRVPRNLLKVLGARTAQLTQNVWRVEEFALTTGKVALKVAHKAVRPVLIAYIAHRALRTIDGSKDIGVRMAKLPPKQAIHMYYQELLGEDFGQQMEADLLDAVREVEEGLVTEDYKEEKRLLSAAMLRRLEVEEWDKQRMKHFYLGSYGLGPWYFDMEERLHNPYFIGARAWNGPPESWIGQNKVYMNDLPLRAKPDEAAIAAIEAHLGKRLNNEQRARVLAAGKASPADLLTSPGGLLDGIVSRGQVQEHLAAAH